ncbi:hypothetical protein [Pseudomonas sp. MWU12-2345]|uniref:hypothetical protein n=1 Tax=Pseudomonas sp. MWU12-2345 TaxID=2928689 RepID=UPI00200D2277|nr:hypothetical protein [Pseudomonas sp. MWU12-2345]
MSELIKLPVIDRISIVLRPAEGQTLEVIQQHVQLGAHVSIGRGLAVIAGASDRDVVTPAMEETEFCIDDQVRMRANARRYEWLRNVAFDTPRQDLVPRDRLGNMLVEQDLDGEIDRAMKAYPGERKDEPCAD